MAASVLALAGSACLAAEGGSPVYVKVLGKYVMPSDPEVLGLEIESDNGYGFGGAVGLQYDQFRVEAEIATHKTDIDAITLSGWNGPGVGIGSGDTRITTYMVNGYYGFPLGQGFGIYVTGGLGMGTTTISISNVDDDDSGLAWKAGAGVSYAFDSNMAVDFGWEYVGLDDPTIDNVEVSDVYGNNIVAAFRYRF